jgi:hypothetical protein
MHVDTLITNSYLFVLTWKVSTVVPFRVPHSHAPSSCKGTQPHMTYSIPLTHLDLHWDLRLIFFSSCIERYFTFEYPFKTYHPGIKVRNKASYFLKYLLQVVNRYFREELCLSLKRSPIYEPRVQYMSWHILYLISILIWGIYSNLFPSRFRTVIFTHVWSLPALHMFRLFNLWGFYCPRLHCLNCVIFLRKDISLK